MSAKSITGFVFLFIFLFLLILVHFVFIFIFFLAIIIVIANKIKQRKKSKSNTGKSDHLKDQKNSSADSISDVTSDDAENILDDDDLIENKSKLNAFSLKEEEEESKTSNKSPTLMNSKTTNNNTKTSQKSENLSLQTDSVALPDKPVKTPKKSFNRARWNFRSDQSIEQKKRKFLKAIDICEQNDIGSKAKIRRLRIKLDKWNVENERDIDALIPDYEYLLDLIEEFETEK